jgi:RimJ/RimL family protein N-acetyltransferase
VERADDRGRVIGDVYLSITSVANFAKIGLHRVSAQLDPRNVPSAALCRRLGMREEARFVEDTWFKGAWADTSVYAILDREWMA